MKSMRTHWLLSTAILSGFASPGLAQSPAMPMPGGIAPSIEVHSDVIESLREAAYAPATSPAAPPPAPVEPRSNRAPVNTPEVRETFAPALQAAPTERATRPSRRAPRPTARPRPHPTARDNRHRAGNRHSRCARAEARTGLGPESSHACRQTRKRRFAGNGG